jgi:hypothetical protein
MHSPIGVAIIAVLNIISGIILLITGLGLIALGTIVPGMPPPSAFEQSQNMTDPADIDLSDVSPRVFEAVVVAIGGIITAVGVVSFIVAYGLLKGMGWAWTLTVVLPIISILLNAISLQENLGGIVCVIISGIILYYIYRSPVKSYFGRGSSPALSATT